MKLSWFTADNEELAESKRIIMKGYEALQKEKSKAKKESTRNTEESKELKELRSYRDFMSTLFADNAITVSFDKFKK